MSGHCRITPDESPSGLVSEAVGALAPVIGRIETLVGSCTVSRSGGPAVAIKIGDLVGPTDVIETAAGGRLSIRFTDGTTFTLSDNARMALKDYVDDTTLALFDVSRGTFSFIAGKMAEAGHLCIQTPFASIRARRNGGGIGMLSLISLFFAVFEEAQAAPSDIAFLDDGNITSKDLGQFGIVELLVKATATTPEQHRLIDDPGETIVIRSSGSSVSVDSVTNSIAQMAQYQAAQQEALHTFSVGLQGQGPTGNGGGGSGTLLTPEILSHPQNINFVPDNNPPPSFTPPPGSGFPQQNNVSDPLFVGPPPPPPPPPPPSETINAAIGTNTGVTATINSGGLTDDNTLTVTGTIISSNLSSVSIHVFDGSTDLGPVTFDESGNWSLTTDPLPDGLHTFTAVATGNFFNSPITAGPVTAIVDTLPPTVAVNIVDASLSDSDSSSVVTFTFSEKVSDATFAGLASGAGITVTGGTLSALTWNAGHTAATATFTATDGNETTGSVTVDANSYTDVAGNLGSSGTDSVPIDTKNPTVAVNIVDASLSDSDSSSVVTFTFSEKVSDATFAGLASGAGITVTGGTLSALTWNAGHTAATATFTATDGNETTGSVTVDANSYTDVAGNLGSSGTDSVPIDTKNPTVAVNIVDASLSDSDSSSVVTFTFSEKVSDATFAGLASGAGITVTGGTLSALTWNAGHTAATATFTATDGNETTGSVTVDANSYTDVAGNLGSSGTDSVPIDTKNPTVAVNIVDASLSDSDSSSVVTFTFSEKVSDATFAGLASGAGITVTGGTLSALTWNAGHTAATATFTATDGNETTGSVTVDANSYTDVAGNLGSSGTDSVPIDTKNPTVAVNIVDASLSDSDSSSVVTFTFSEKVSDATFAGLASGAGITVTGGTLSALTWNAGHTAATATFTATDGNETTGSVTVDANSYTDVAGNLGSSGTDSVPIDTKNPTVAVNIVDASLSDSDSSSVVTFTFSEKVSDATFAGLASGAGITVTGGTLSALTWNAGHTAATATFTATDGNETTGSVTVDANSYTDVAGNLGSSGTDSVPIDTKNPTVAVNIVDASLSDSDSSSVVTFTFSEKVSDATFAGLASGAGITVTGGTLSALTWNAGHTAATATFTATDGNETTGSVTVDANSYTDVAGNLGSSGTDSVPIDTKNPTVAVNIVDASLSDSDSSSVVTFTFSEKVSDATFAGLASGAGITVTGGTLSALTWNAGHTAATATFTATDGNETTGSVTVDANSYTDVAGNLGSSGTDSVPIDTKNPTVAVNIVDASLSDSDSSSVVTFTFSEKVSDATFAGLASGAGITVTGGTLSALTWNAGHTAATATFTATDGNETTGSVTVDANSYTDVAGNLGSSGTDSVPIDTKNPTVAVNIVDASLSDSDSSSVVTFTFSEKVSDATFAGLASGAGITVTGGTLSALTWNAGHTAATATFTATDGNETTGSVTVDANSYTDVAGNLGSSGTDSVPIDTKNPTVAVNIVDASLSDSDSSSVVTFTFSEKVSDATFAGLASGAGITVTGGTLSALTWNAGHTAATATFTATDGNETTGSVTVDANSYTDVAGNLGSSGTDSVPIDTKNPTVAVNIVDASLSDSDSSSVVTFTFSEKVSDATFAGLASGAGITVTGGTLSALTWNAGHTAATATFTATDGNETTGSVTVDANSYTDVAGNLGSSGTDSVPIDTKNPTVAVNIVDASLSDSDSSSVVTFTFSEKVSDATFAGLASGAGITVTGGTLSALTWNAGHTAATATFTATDGNETTGSVTVDANSYTDVAGNLGSSGTDSVPIDTKNPTVAVNIVDASLSDSDSSSVVTFTFSEKVSDATFAGLASGAGITVTGGTLSALTWNAGHTAATATFTATDGNETTGSVTVDANSYTDVAGNLGSSGTDSVPIDTKNPTVAVNIVDASLSDSDSSSVVTFTFSEKVSDATFAGLASGAGITVTGGTLSALTWNAGHTAATATFTATDGNETTGSVTVDANSYTDVAGNLGSSGTDSVPIDTKNPTVAVNIVDASLSDSDSSSVVTFTFSEKVSDATFAGLASGAGITVTGGTLSALTWNAGHTAATATFTATDGNETTGSVTVDANSYTDVAGNLGSSGTDSVPIDTKNPTVAVNIVDASLSDSDSSSVVTFTFSEAPTNFDASDITASHGTISGLTKNLALDPSGKTYTATFTAQSGFFGTGSVSVGTAWQDSAGNTGGSGSDTVAIDTDNDLTGALSGLTGGNAVEAHTVSVSTLSDGGISVIGDTTDVTYSWQVFRNGVWYQEGNHRSFTPSAADLGLQLRVVVSYVEQEQGESGTETITLPAGTVQDEAAGAAGFADATGNGNWQSSNKWSSNQVPGASTNVELDGNGGFQITMNDVRSANSLYISGSGNSVVLNGASTPGLTVTGAVTVLNGGLLDLSANGATLMAGSITGTITVDNTAVITGSSGSTIVGPSGTGPWAEIITDATIFIANSGKTVSGPSPGTGGIAIDSGATLTLTGGTHAENILFANNFPDNHLDSGTLVISGGTAFTGLVYGFAASGGFSDIIDLKSISSDAGTTWAYTDNIGSNTGGTLAIFENGIKEASIAFGNGDYITANFKVTGDGAGGTFITDPPVTNDSAATATAETSLTTNTDTVSFVSGTNQVLATDLTATNGDMITGGTGSDTLTIDTGAGTNHIFVFGDGGNGHSDIGLVKFENLTLTDKNASANDQDSITVTFDSNFQNGGTLTVDGSALHELNGTNLTIDARLATHDSFVLVGSNAADTLTGGSHGDIIVGNGGGDTLTGGGGGDSFVFKTLTVSQPGGSHFDTITDFTHNSDHIDLTAIAGATVVQGNVVTANTVDAHSISWFVDTAHNQTVVYVNTTDAANTVSMEVHLAGANVNLAGSDILHHT